MALNADLLEDLRNAEKCRALFEAAGTPLRLWEAATLATAEGSLVRREIRRFAQPKPADRPKDVSFELLEKVRTLRLELGSLVKKLRRFFPQAAESSPEFERQELLISFILASGPARKAAATWVSDPARFDAEARKKIQAMDGIVESYRLTLRNQPVTEVRARPPSPGATAVESPDDTKHRHPFAAPAAAAPVDEPAPLKAPEDKPLFAPAPDVEAPPASPLEIPPTLIASAPAFAETSAPAEAPADRPAREPEPEPPPPPPSPPQGLAAQGADGRVDLRWTAVPGAEAYRVKRSDSPDGTFDTVATPEVANHTDRGLKNGTTYSYAVSAVNPGGEGPDSSPVQATPRVPPPVPAGLQAVAGNAEVTLSWLPSLDATSYRLRRSAGGGFEDVAQPASPTYTDTGLVNGTNYGYVVCAVNAAGASADSAPVRVVPLAPPPMPAGLSASPANGRITLSWTPLAEAKGYHLKRADAAGGPYETIASPPGTSHSDTGLANGNTYFYVLSAFNEAGESANSEPAQASPVAPPSAPADVIATPGNARVGLAWNAVSDSVKYNVKRATSPGGPYATIASPSAPAYTDLTATNGTTYYYVVTAVNVGGESDASPQAQSRPLAPPPAPGGLSVNSGDGRVVLSWSAQARAAHYNVKRGAAAGGPFSTVATPSGTSHSDTGLANGTTYYYVVTAANVGGESAPSAAIAATPVAPPPAPTSLSAQPGNGRVGIGWGPSGGASSYVVKRSTSAEGPYAPVGATAKASYVDGTVTNGTTYYYVVCASNAGGESPHSGAISAVPLSPPGTPTALAAAPGNGKVSLTWAPGARASGYQVKRTSTPGGPYGTIATVAANSYVDATVANGTTYFYVVAALNAGGESHHSQAAQATPSDPPAAPGGLAASSGNGRVSLTWNAVPRATHYRVLRGSTAAGPFESIATPASTFYTDSTAQNGMTYFYAVAGVNAGGESGRSTAIPAAPMSPPETPEGLKAVPGDGEVALSWSSVPGATGYKLKRGTSPGGPFTTVSTPLVTHLTNGMVTNGTTYYYVVLAVNPGGESAPSSPVEATPLAPPAVPIELTAVVGPNQVALNWTPPSRATGYRVKRSSMPGGPFETVGSPSAPPYVDLTLTGGLTYYYVVSAINAAGEGSESYPIKVSLAAAAAPALPAAAALAPPASVTAVAGPGQVTLSWSAVAGAVRYVVQRSLDRRGPYTTLATPAAPAYVDTKVSNGVSYHYIVFAASATSRSGHSQRVQAMPGPGAATPAGGADAPAPLPAPSEDGGAAKPSGGAAVAVLERVQRPTSGVLPREVDLEKLLDFRRLFQMQEIYAETGRPVELWEIYHLLATSGAPARNAIEEVVKAKREQGKYAEKAAALWGAIAQVRTEVGTLVRQFRDFLKIIDVRGEGRPLEIALAFFFSSDRARQRIDRWLGDPDGHRREAVAYLEYAIEMAKKYDEALRSKW